MFVWKKSIPASIDILVPGACLILCTILKARWNLTSAFPIMLDWWEKVTLHLQHALT